MFCRVFIEYFSTTFFFNFLRRRFQLSAQEKKFPAQEIPIICAGKKIICAGNSNYLRRKYTSVSLFSQTSRYQAIS
jgi:hypothetical protein